MAKITALKCPSCSANISANTNKCEYCGTEFVISPDRTALTFSGMEDCPKCRHPNPKGQWFCSQCGAVITADVHLIETRQKRERFLQNKAREELPKDLLERLEPNEYIHHFFYKKDRFCYLITEKKLAAWFHQPKIWGARKESTELWELKYDDIATISEPEGRRSSWDGEVQGYHLEIGTYANEKKILEFGNMDLSGSWDFRNILAEAYANYLNHHKDIHARIYSVDLEVKDSTKTISDTCFNCGKAVSNFPKDISFCPYCGKQLKQSGSSH